MHIEMTVRTKPALSRQLDDEAKAFMIFMYEGAITLEPR